MIQSVTFTLHPTFSTPVVVVSSPPFELARRGWGTFEIGIDVLLKNGKLLKTSHNLSFNQSKTEKIIQA